MGWSESELSCKKHQNQNQNHKQFEGVCPICLRERLAQLSSVQKKPSSMVAPSCSSSLSSSPTYSSAASFSNAMSPVPRGHHRNVSEIMGSISLMLSFGNYGLKKSRSIAFVPRNLVADQLNNGKKKKKGFWSKLLHRERKKEILMPSRTVSMREI